MTVLTSMLFEREGFRHGFGTSQSIPGDFPADVHILLQVHGEKIVVLTDSGGWKVEGGRKDPSWKSEIGGNSLEIKVVPLPPSPFRFDEGDAMVSDIPGVSMGIRTADCLPVLIADRLNGTAAAVHCGWRSLALGLAGKAVRAMGEIMASETKHLLAAIGPSIGPCCYEVGEEVRDAFLHGDYGKGLFEVLDGKLFMDLASGVKTQLISEGMAPETIDEITGCTSCNPDQFWSHRARKEEERMVSFITVREPWK
jgi:YfiH family protein